MRRAIVRRVRHWIANRGWRGFFAEVWRRVGLWVRGERRGGAARGEGADAAKPHPFDMRHGVDTGGLIWGEALLVGAVGKEGPRVAGAIALARDAHLSDGGAVAKMGHPDYVAGEDSAYWVTGYYGVAPSVLWAALEQLELPWEQTTFVDVGCGKGRAMLLALRYPFRRVVGVELSPELARVAEENVRRFHAEWRRTDVPVEVRAGDAAATELPAGPLLLFLYHPFAAPVMTRFLGHVRDAVRAEPREVVLLYMNPELDGLLRRTAFLERMWDACFGLSAEDRAADRFESEWERMVAYRVVPER